MKLFTPSQASHWYFPDGRACHEVEMKTKPGQMRSTTVADARKMGLLPSSTNIIGVIDRPELNAWKQSQAVLAALTLPRNPLEGDDDFAERVVRDAQEQVSKAASIGTKIHSAIEELLCFENIRCDKEVEHLFTPFIHWAKTNIGEIYMAEQTVIGNGYCGRLDLKAELAGVGKAIIDFKTRKPYNGKFAVYSNDDLQLSSYQMADGDANTTRVSILINSQEPATPHVHIWDRAKDDASYKAFLAAFELWKYQKNYSPI